MFWTFCSGSFKLWSTTTQETHPHTLLVENKQMWTDPFISTPSPTVKSARVLPAEPDGTTTLKKPWMPRKSPLFPLTTTHLSSLFATLDSSDEDVELMENDMGMVMPYFLVAIREQPTRPFADHLRPSLLLTVSGVLI